MMLCESIAYTFSLLFIIPTKENKQEALSLVTKFLDMFI